jgi:hypothetical protein
VEREDLQFSCYKILHSQMIVLFGIGTMTKAKILLMNPIYPVIIYLVETSNLYLMLKLEPMR